MRQATKDRLLTVLKADLEKVNAQLRRDFHEEWHTACDLVTRLYNRARTVTKIKDIENLELHIKKAQIARDKAEKLALGSTKKLDAWYKEKFKLEDEIQELQNALHYVRTDA
jgi:hypothetical protein